MAVRLPDETALGRAPGLATSRRVPPTVPTVAEAIGPTFERTGEKLGAIFERREGDQEAFSTQAQFIDFQDQQQKALLERQKAAPPGAVGFGKTIRDEYIKAAGQFLGAVPPRLQGEFDVRLRAFESRLTNAADLFETQEGKRHAVGTIEDRVEQLSIAASQDPASAPAKIGEAISLIRLSPKLTPPEKEELERKVRAKVTMAGQQGLIDSDPDAARAWSDTQYGGAYASKVGKSESNNSYDPASTPTSRSTDGRGRYGFLKDGFVKLAREIDPTLKDKTDDEVFALARGKENAEMQEKVFRLFTQRNEQALKAAGLPVTDTTRYLAHWFGAGGATKILKADPNTPIEQFMPSGRGADGVPRSPAEWAKVNGLQGKTVKDVVALAQQRMNESASTVPGSPQVPTTGRQFVVPDGISYQDYLRLRTYGDQRVKQLRGELDEYAQTVQQDVLLGRKDHSELTSVAAQYRRLGANAQATLFEDLAGDPEAIKRWQAASTPEQRAQLLAAKAPLLAAARLSEEETKRRTTEVLKRAKSALETAESDLKANQPLDQVMPRLQEIFAIATQTKDPELMERVRKVAGDYNALEALRSMPPATQEAALRKARSDLMRDGGDPGAAARLKWLETDYDKFQTNLTKDPWSAATDRYNMQVSPLPDIRQPSPQVIASLRTRAAQAQAAAVQVPEHAAKLVPFSDEEMALMAAAFDKAPANQKAVMLNTMAAGLGPEWFAKTMKAMSDKGNGALAWAGGLSSVEGPSARIILEGADVIKNNKRIVPEGAALATAIDEAIGTTFRDAGARAMVDDAIRAAYAKHAFDAGRTDGKYDADIANKAFKTVLGNIVSYRGQTVIPLRRDMGPGEFADVIARLQDSDIPELKTVEGDKITADRIKQFGVLTSAGDGRYTVRLPDRGGVLKEIPDPTRQGQAFILDARPLLTRPPPPKPAPPPGEAVPTGGGLGTLRPATVPPPLPRPGSRVAPMPPAEGRVIGPDGKPR